MPRGRVMSTYVKQDMAAIIDRAVEEGEYNSVSAILTTGLRMWQRAREGTASVPGFDAEANLNPEYAAAVEEELCFGFLPEARAGRNSRLVAARISDQDARAMDVLRETPGVQAETTSDLLRGFVRVCLRAIDRLNLQELDQSWWHTWVLAGTIEQERFNREAAIRAVNVAADLLADDLAAYQRLGRVEPMYAAYFEFKERISRLGPEAERVGQTRLAEMPDAQTILAQLGR